MFAVYADTVLEGRPALRPAGWGSGPTREVPDGWTTVTVKAASLNHHDLFSLRGVGLREEALPMILGCDAAGLDEDGNEVVVHAVISDPSWNGDETLDPKRSLLSERYQGTFADKVAVPRRNVVPKPASLSFEEAACPPTAWLTAYRMLFTRGQLRAGETVLVQGAGGGWRPPSIVLGPRCRAAGAGDQPRRGQAGAGRSSSAPTRSSSPAPGCRSRSTRSSRPSAGRPGRTPIRRAASGRPDRHLGYDVGPNLDDAELTRIFFLQLERHRLHDGHPRGARRPGVAARRHRSAAADRPDDADDRCRGRGSPPCSAASMFGKIVFTR